MMFSVNPTCHVAKASELEHTLNISKMTPRSKALKKRVDNFLNHAIAISCSDTLCHFEISFVLSATMYRTHSL